MKTHPLDRLLKSAATAYKPAVATAALEPVLEYRVLAAMRRARSKPKASTCSPCCGGASPSPDAPRCAPFCYR